MRLRVALKRDEKNFLERGEIIQPVDTIIIAHEARYYEYEIKDLEVLPENPKMIKITLGKLINKKSFGIRLALIHLLLLYSVLAALVTALFSMYVYTALSVIFVIIFLNALTWWDRWWVKG